MKPNIPVNSDNESSACVLVQQFAALGIPRDSIGPEHMLPVYSGLKASADTAFRSPETGIVCQASEMPNDEQVWGLILETRQHPLLATVVSQFVNNLSINVQIFHGTGNQQFIQGSSIQPLIESGRVHLTSLGIEQISRRQYNGLFLDPGFWRSVHGRQKLLVFQTDAVLCERSDYRLQDFLHFDYIGSKWNAARPIGINIDGGNGGLSLRNKKAIQQSLSRFPAELWPGGEDGYFAFHLDLMGASVGRSIDCAKFSTQGEFIYRSFGAHQISNLVRPELERFLKYSPEAYATLEQL